MQPLTSHQKAMNDDAKIYDHKKVPYRVKSVHKLGRYVSHTTPNVVSVGKSTPVNSGVATVKNIQLIPKMATVMLSGLAFGS